MHELILYYTKSSSARKRAVTRLFRAFTRDTGFVDAASFFIVLTKKNFFKKGPLSRTLASRWNIADAEIRDRSVENSGLKGFPLKKKKLKA